MEQERTMEQAIRDVVQELETRRVPEEQAREIYMRLDMRYKYTVNHKTRRCSTELYIRREGYALYLKERYGVDMK